MICLEASFNQRYQRCIAHGVSAQRADAAGHTCHEDRLQNEGRAQGAKRRDRLEKTTESVQSLESVQT